MFIDHVDRQIDRCLDPPSVKNIVYFARVLFIFKLSFYMSLVVKLLCDLCSVAVLLYNNNNNNKRIKDRKTE